MLTIKNLNTGYGKRQVLFGVSIDVRESEIVAIIGPNGAGKSTVLKAILGLVPVWDGEIWLGGSLTNGVGPAESVARGITLAPQGRRVFRELTVKENIEIGGLRLPRNALQKRVGDVLDHFPVLKDRASLAAGKLSGGEQQMVALARALIAEPRLLMLDEPSLGLSPKFARRIFDRIVEINRERKTAIIVVEQKVRGILEICSRVYSLKLGKVAFEGPPDELARNGNKLKELFL